MSDLILGDGAVGSAQPAPAATRTLERVILDPLSEDSANVPLEITGRFAGHSIFLVSHAYPPATREQSLAQGFDVEGARVAARGRRGVRQIPVKVWVAEATGIPAATNRIANPKAGRDLTGYTNSGGASMVRELLGTIPYPAECPAETAVHWVGNSDGDHFYYSVAVTSGQAYVFSVWVRLGALTATDAVLEVRDATGTVKATGTAIEEVGSWRRYFLAFSADATATWRLAIRQRGAGGADLCATAAQLETGSTLTDYFDGDTPGCDWAGTTHASTSTRLAAGGADLFQAALNDLEAKINKLADRLGTYKRILPNGDAYTFDVIHAEMGDEWERHFSQGRIAVPLNFVCQPLARQAEQSFSSTDETSLPVLRNTVGPIPGTAPAKVRLEITDLQGADRFAVGYALQMENYDSAATADLFYEAEGRTPLNGASAVAGPGSIGVSGTVVRQASLSGTWAAMLSTQASGGGSHLTHVGAYRVRAKLHRPTSNTGEVRVALEWGVGDLRSFARNDPVVYDVNEREGVMTIADLGIVRIPQIVKGTQRWEGRIIAKSTVATDDLDVDCLWLEPIGEAQGVAKMGYDWARPTAFSARDEFGWTGAINTKALPVGGTWASSGDADDYAAGGSGGEITRGGFAVTDTPNTGRWAIASTPSLGAVAVSVDVEVQEGIVVENAAIGQIHAVVARWTDSSNHVRAGLANSDDRPELEAVVQKRLGGTITTIGGRRRLPIYAPDTWLTVTLLIDTGGRFRLYIYRQGANPGDPILSGVDPDLASGTLASGGVGIYDETSLGASTDHSRNYDNFAAWAPPSDAALFASQSLEFRTDGQYREDAAGAIYVSVTDPSGDDPVCPPSGREARTLRYLVWAARNDPATMAETTLDDLRAQLHVTPRFDVVPKPS